MRKELKKRNLTDQEIELLFAKYDMDNNRELDRKELERLFQDLEGKKQQIETQIQKEQKNRPATAVSMTGAPVTGRIMAAGVPPEEMAKLVRRIDRMEYTLTVIVNKIESVLDGRLILPKNDKKEDENRNNTSGI